MDSWVAGWRQVSHVLLPILVLGGYMGCGLEIALGVEAWGYEFDPMHTCFFFVQGLVFCTVFSNPTWLGDASISLRMFTSHKAAPRTMNQESIVRLISLGTEGEERNQGGQRVVSSQMHGCI